MPLPTSPVCLIADRFTDEAVQASVIQAAEAGIRWVQLRDHKAQGDVFARQARRIVDRLREVDPNIAISINARLDVAEDLGLDFHTGRLGPAVGEAKARLGDAVIGYSAHDAEEAVVARQGGADYITFSPIFPTASKPGAQPAGLPALLHVVAAVRPLPVLALGGIDASNAVSCIEAGARAVAVIGSILRQPDIAEAVRNLLEATGSAG